MVVSLFTKFQFHYGSVKRRFQELHRLWLVKFQFHYGSVKSLFGLRLYKSKDYFNSTMVRLKVLFFKFCTSI